MVHILIIIMVLQGVSSAQAFSLGTLPRPMCQEYSSSSLRPLPTSQRSGYSMAVGDFLPEHFEVKSLGADAFAAAPPVLRTVVVNQIDETHEVLLLWSPSGEAFADSAPQCESEILVGKLLFKEGITGKFERTMGGLVAHLDQVVVLKGMRGQGGGDLLVHDMVGAPTAGVGRGAEGGGFKFVALRHTDLGSGKLVDWYRQLGFVKAAEYCDDLKKSGDDLMIAEMPTLLERVKGVRF